MRLGQAPFIAMLVSAALCAYAHAAPASYDYAGQAVDDLKRKGVQSEALSSTLEVVSGYGFSSPQVAWVTHVKGQITGTLSYWPSGCSALTTSTSIRWEQRGALRASVIREAGASLLQLGDGCWVAYGPARAQQHVQAELLSLPTDQTLPHRNRNRALELAIDQLRQFQETPFAKGSTPRWEKLQAGQATGTPEDAAQLAGFEEAKVSNRESPYGVGYILKCGAARVKGKAGLLVLQRDTGVVRQFAAYLAADSAAAEFNRLNRELGAPAIEDMAAGRKTYTWLSDRYKTSLGQQAEGDWLFRWQPLTEGSP